MSATNDEQLTTALAALDAALAAPATLTVTQRAELAALLLRIEGALSAAAPPRQPDDVTEATAQFAVEHPAVHHALQRLGAMLMASGV